MTLKGFEVIMLVLELIDALEALNVSIRINPTQCESIGARGYWCEEDWEIVIEEIDEEVLFHEATHTLQSILGGLVGFDPTKSAIERVAACSYEDRNVNIEIEAFSVMETRQYQEELVEKLASLEVKNLYIAKMKKRERNINGCLAMLAGGGLFGILTSLNPIFFIAGMSCIWGCVFQYKKL